MPRTQTFSILLFSLPNTSLKLLYDVGNDKTNQSFEKVKLVKL